MNTTASAKMTRRNIVVPMIPIVPKPSQTGRTVHVPGKNALSPNAVRTKCRIMPVTLVLMPVRKPTTRMQTSQILRRFQIAVRHNPVLVGPEFHGLYSCWLVSSHCAESDDSKFNTKSIICAIILILSCQRERPVQPCSRTQTTGRYRQTA